MSCTTYLETGSFDPCFNLAFEEFVLCNRTEGDYLLLWQNRNTVVVGRNQNTEEEINRPFVSRHRIHVVRRMTGGGAVYHDLGNLNYSLITDAPDAERISMERFTLPVVNALRGLGLDAEASGRNDILVSGRKVSGTAQRLYRDRILHHGTLLFDSDPEMIAGALCADPEKFRSKSTKSVRSRVGNIRSFLPTDMTLEQFWGYLKSCLCENGFETGELDKQELNRIRNLKREKYDTWEWNYGKSPKYDIILQQIKGPLHAQGADIFRNAFSLGQPEAFLQLVLVDADLPAKVNDRRRVLKTGLQDSLCLFYRTNLVLVEIDRRLCG